MTQMKEKLVLDNIAFAKYIAKQYTGYNISYEDLVSQAYEGLITAASKYDETKNAKFCTYAIWWIRDSLNKLIYEYANNVRIPIGNKKALTDNKWKMASLDQDINSEDRCGTTLGDLVEDTRFLNTEDRFSKKAINKDLKRAISALKPIEQKVVLLRFGFLKDAPESLQEVGDELGYSKEGIRQIETKAIRKLRKILLEMGYSVEDIAA